MPTTRIISNNNEMKTVVNIPWSSESGWSRTNLRVSNEQDAYAKVPLVYRALRARVSNLMRVPLYVYENDKLIDKYAFEDSLPLYDLVSKSELSILLAGVAYNLKLPNTFGFQKGLQWLNPFSIQSTIRNGELLLWQQLADGRRFPKNPEYWTEEDFLLLKEFNPIDDFTPGPSATSVALGNSKMSANLTQLLGDFLGADAIPVTMVNILKDINQTERERVENFFTKRLQGFKRGLARVLAVKGSEIKVEKLTAELKSFEIEKLDTHMIDEVAMSFDIPSVVLLGKASNKAEAEAWQRYFVETTIIPRCRYYERHVNPLLEEFDQRIEFVPEELSEMQEDEAFRSDAASKYIQAGFTLEEVVDILGIDMSEDVGKKFKARMEAKELQSNLLSLPASISDPHMIDNTVLGNGQMKQELDRWLKKALNKIKSGKSALVEFESEKIPIGVKTIISEKLKEAKTEDDVRLVFAQVEMKVQQV